MSNRREFLRTVILGGFSAWGVIFGCRSASAQTRSKNSSVPLVEIPQRWWKPLTNNKVQCFICPLNCVLSDGQICGCNTRLNVKGRLMTMAYGNPCIISIDPVEKLPLHHFLAGSQTLSIATAGCNLRCLYCQNWQQSQVRPDQLRNYNLPPSEAVKKAKERGIPIIAYTYTEPVVFWEYVMSISELAKSEGLKNVVATALFMTKEPIREWCKVTDAFAVSLKGFDDEFYLKVVGAPLKPILDAILTVKSEGAWLELVTLIVPTLNDDTKRIREMCLWIRRNLGTQVPLHFGRFVPEYKLRNLPRTPVSTLEQCREIALDTGLQFVYLFNVAPHDANHTYCPKCHTPVVRRLGFKLTSNNLQRGICPKCKTRLPGVW